MLVIRFLSNLFTPDHGCHYRKIKMDWEEHKNKLLEDPEFKKEYEALATEYKAVSTAIRRRLKRSAASAPETK